MTIYGILAHLPNLSLRSDSIIDEEHCVHVGKKKDAIFIARSNPIYKRLI